MTSLLQRMGCFLKKAIFTMVLDMAYPRLILHHKVTLLIFRPFPLPPMNCKEVRGSKIK